VSTNKSCCERPFSCLKQDLDKICTTQMTQFDYKSLRSQKNVPYKFKAEGYYCRTKTFIFQKLEHLNLPFTVGSSIVQLAQTNTGPTEWSKTVRNRNIEYPREFERKATFI
jgi:hypothetical protein